MPYAMRRGEDQAIQMPPMRTAEAARRAGGARRRDLAGAEPLLDQYDVVLASPSLMITHLNRMSKMTAGTVTTAMTDQHGGHLPDIAARASDPPGAGNTDRQQS
jgi:hypothetical protein